MSLYNGPKIRYQLKLDMGVSPVLGLKPTEHAVPTKIKEPHPNGGLDPNNCPKGPPSPAKEPQANPNPRPVEPAKKRPLQRLRKDLGAGDLFTHAYVSKCSLPQRTWK